MTTLFLMFAAGGSGFALLCLHIPRALPAKINVAKKKRTR